MGIFPDAQRQLTPEYVVGSGRPSNSIETLWLFLLPARMNTIREKIKALEQPQNYKSTFRRSRTDNSIVNGGI